LNKENDDRSGKNPALTPRTAYVRTFALADNPLTIPLSFAVLRELARRRKEAGEPWPWSSDPVLAGPRSFCNVRREDDKTTRWIAERLRKADDPNWPAALVLARLFNRISTIEALFDGRPGEEKPFARAVELNSVGPLRAVLERLPKPHVSNAYTHPSPPGMGLDKGSGVLAIFATFLRDDGPMGWRRYFEYLARPNVTPTLAAAHDWYKRIPYVDDFIAAQFIADAKYLEPLSRAPDWFTWAAPGPGSRRGLNIVLDRDPDAAWDSREWLRDVRWLQGVLNPRLEAIGHEPLHAQDAQNVLCETAKAWKFARSEAPITTKGHLKQGYRPPAWSFLETEAETLARLGAVYAVDRAALLETGVDEFAGLVDILPDMLAIWRSFRAESTKRRPTPTKKPAPLPQGAPGRLEAVLGSRMPDEGETAALELPRAAAPISQTFYEFFSGGGMARAGLGPSWRCLLANDNDTRKAASYIANFGGRELIVRDVAALTAADLPGCADLAWASPPCQDVSEAGPRVGLEGGRSGAFWPFWRLIEGLNAQRRAPRIVVLENVTGLLESHEGRDIAAIRAAFEREGYAHATAVIDAARFVPQSRPRVFVIGARAGDVAARVEEALAHLPMRNVDLIELLEDGPDLEWRPPEEAARHLAMMSPVNLAKVEAARAAGRPIAGVFYRRIRKLKGGTKVQRAEIRFDGLAGALRVASTGGSSVQFVLVVDGPQARMRAMTPREYARLMGLPEDYRLPTNIGEARSLCGDGVCVPVVRFIAERIIEPLLQLAAPPARAAE
jgi:DNA (cytosine-5)-methyltransferase 1